ncbi:MAG: hypothetical protein HY329_11365 [Chloroflexi bacterium]|nr:hypothetical protein [Chloroflexota bacterium]
MTVESNGREALDELFWQDEILQAMYWLRGEGLAEVVGRADLARLLASEPRTVGHQMGRLAAGGYLERVGRGRYRLTEMGRLEGARSFRDEFADFTRSGHGECADDCWCKNPDRAGEPCPSHSH